MIAAAIFDVSHISCLSFSLVCLLSLVLMSVDCLFICPPGLFTPVHTAVLQATKLNDLPRIDGKKRICVIKLIVHVFAFVTPCPIIFTCKSRSKSGMLN